MGLRRGGGCAVCVWQLRADVTDGQTYRRWRVNWMH